MQFNIVVEHCGKYFALGESIIVSKINVFLIAVFSEKILWTTFYVFV